MRLPRPGGDQAGVVERIDDLRALARLVVDLLVRARGEEAGERVDDRQRARAGPSRLRSTPCPARRSRLDEALGSCELEAADAAVGGEVGVEHDEAVVAPGELEQRLAVAVGDVLVAHGQPRRPGAPAPLVGSPSRLAAGSASVSGGAGSSVERRQGQRRQTLVDPRDQLGNVPRRTRRRRALLHASGTSHRRRERTPGAP